MSIASRIEQIEQHLKDDYDVLGLAGAKGTELPIGYTQVDYIESSGTQYIDTGYTPNINTEVIIEFKDTNKSNWENYFGSENFRFLRRANDSTAFRWQCITNADITNLSIDNKRKLKFNKNGIYDENGTLILSNLQTSLTSTKNMLLFLSWLGSSFDNFGIFMMYSFKIYDNGTLVRNFIPCYRNSDNEVGMYDLVNDVFYTNKGTGAFTYGSVVLNRNIQNLKPQWLDRLLYFLANGTDVIWNNWLPKVTGSGETITLNNTIEAKMDFVYKGNTSQNGTPTPDNPINIDVVTGNNSIKVEGKNLFNKNGDIMSDYRLNTSGGNYLENGYYISPYIQVEPNTTYTKNSPTADALHRVCFYTSNDINTFISKSEDNTITTPSNCQYLRFCGLQTELDTAMLEKSSTATTYEPYVSQNYPISLGNIELCKIGDYQDRIYKDSGKWYIEKQIGKVVLDGSENWNYEDQTTRAKFSSNALINNSVATQQNLSNYFRIGSANIGILNVYSNNWIDIFVEPMVLADFKTWLSTHNTIVYYPCTPTYEEITDTTLISQLEAIKKSYNTQTNISQTNDDMPFILDVVALGELEI